MKSAYKACISLIVLIATAVCMFLFARNYNSVFWVNFAFSIASIILASFVILVVAANGKRMFGMSVATYAIYYVIVDLVYAFKTVFVPALLVRKVAIVHVVLMAAFMIVIILSKAEDEFIAEQQETRGRELANFKFTLEQMKKVQSKVEYGAAYRKTVEHAYDSLASGQTVSTPHVEDIEKAILDTIANLEKAVSSKDEAQVNEICGKIEDLAAERKAVLSSKMNF